MPIPSKKKTVTINKRNGAATLILSLFSGCGGLDLGFEMAGYKTALAFDIRPHSISSWNRNRPQNPCGHVADITQLSLEALDRAFGSKFAPFGVIGGPPCQSFTKANHFRSDADPRSKLVNSFFTLALQLHNTRRPLDFIVMENVRELARAQEGLLLKSEIKRLEEANFSVNTFELNAKDFGVPQNRHRLFLVALNSQLIGSKRFRLPTSTITHKTVRDALFDLPEPVYFSKSSTTENKPYHPNHWCMTPKSRRFFDGSLKAGACSSRSFKTLAWDQPSKAVSYGHREVHVHPSGKRRLSVFEAMRLQGFPDKFVLNGTLSAQVDQVSEAVPPPLAEAVARAVKDAIHTNFTDQSAPKAAENSSKVESAVAV
ncbi:DNA (cytosine-5-)-methyltransferase [Stappia sp. GBMRC 2046]|uniref:DNA (cytosine-5-)-methyltransferase n=2 Tax=Stappia sediminis TaxID=2692190 RepID=A0A7X3S9C1_9HYPH|nr:DNA (cytosine-5-)-methyltransferase [Stappia sediminis]